VVEFGLLLVLTLAGVGEGFVVPLLNHRQSSREFIESVDRAVPVDKPIVWTNFGSHSDYLWHFRELRIGRHGVPEVSERLARLMLAATDDTARPMTFAIVTGEQAARLHDVAAVVLRDDSFQRKNRSVVLLKSKEPK
jgi:hypothetical protein